MTGIHYITGYLLVYIRRRNYFIKKRMAGVYRSETIWQIKFGRLE